MPFSKKRNSSVIKHKDRKSMQYLGCSRFVLLSIDVSVGVMLPFVFCGFRCFPNILQDGRPSCWPIFRGEVVWGRKPSPQTQIKRDKPKHKKTYKNQKETTMNRSPKLTFFIFLLVLFPPPTSPTGAGSRGDGFWRGLDGVLGRVFWSFGWYSGRFGARTKINRKNKQNIF